MAIFSKESAPEKTAPPRSEPPPVTGASYFGPNIVFEGTLSGAESVVFEGTMKGRIDLKSDLRVGPKARVEANVHARNVTIEGTMKGDVSADARVELIATARVDGNIKAPKIIVAEGARFRGAVDMGSEKPSE